jgi:hypothetical protein
MSHGGLVEISEALGDSRLEAVLEIVYRASGGAPMGLALPWHLRWKVNRLLDPTVRRYGIGGGNGLFPGIHYLDVDGDAAMQWAATVPLVITCTEAFRTRLERKGIPFRRFPEGMLRLPGPEAALLVARSAPPPKRRAGTLSGRKGFSSMLVTSS